MSRSGRLLASAAHATGAVAVNGNWAIGARGTCTERFFQGAIDEVRIYSRALDPGEIGVLAGTDTGPVVQYEYDSLGRQVKIIQPDADGSGPLASPETSYAYDAAGQLTAVTDPLGRVTTFDYDGLGRQVKVTQPDPHGPGGQAPPFQATVYDAAGRVLQTSNALGHTTAYAYDPLGRVVSQTDALGGVTSFRYDALGNRLSLTDPVDNTTTWTYDALNRVVQETNELGYSRYFVYNPGGYLTRRIDRRGLVREFQYDTLGRNTAEIWYDTAADAEMDANRQNTLNFAYDALGRMLSAGDQFASYAYAYDHLGRMTSSDAAIAGLAPTVTLTNAYDAAGRRTQVAAAIGGSADFVTNYAYDQLGRTTSIRQSAGGAGNLPVADKRVDFTYDLASQPVALTRYADLGGNQLVAATDYLFDQAGRLTGMTHSKGASIFADYDWTFDEANRMTRFESLIDGAADYTNDDTGQLTAAEYTAGTGLPTAPPDEQYVYDENGNRINNGYTTGPNNQLLSDGIHTYTYDEEGNRTSRTDIATGEVTEYHWDHSNRLVRVSTRATANGPLTTDIHYAYDFGQRWIRKTLDMNADGAIEESRIFVHDNGQIVLDFQTTGTGDASSGDLSHRYLWGHHVDQILADETVDTATADVAWALTDHLNTVRDLLAYDPATDTTSVIKHLTYGAFGNVTNDSAPGIDSLFLFTARPYDPDTGLQNNLNRWYDLSTGRWMSEDPIGFEAGDANLLRYVGNGPMNETDPTGLTPLFDSPDWIHHVGGPLVPVEDFRPGCCGKEIGPMLDALSLRARQAFSRLMDNSPVVALSACIGKDGPWGWDIHRLTYESKYQFSEDGCGTNDCRGTVMVHGQCHWASDVNYFLWGMANQLCAAATWYSGDVLLFAGSENWSEASAVRSFMAWRAFTFWFGDGTTAGRLAWTRAGYRGNTTVPTMGNASKCGTCGKADYGMLNGHFGDHIIRRANVFF